MSINARIGRKIRLARKQAGYTQAQLAKKLGKTGAAIAYLEQGKRRISPDILEKIALMTNRPLGFFYEDQSSSPSQLGTQLQSLQQQLDALKEVLLHVQQDGVGSQHMDSSDQWSLSDRAFREVFDHANDLMILMGPDGTILDINERYEEFFGWGRAEMVGRKFTDFQLFSEAEMPGYIKLFEKAFASQEPLRHMEVRVRTKSAEMRVLQTSNRILMRNQRPWAMLSILRSADVRSVNFDEAMAQKSV
jgi:PAS domain S-box-containing protein